MQEISFDSNFQLDFSPVTLRNDALTNYSNYSTQPVKEKERILIVDDSVTVRKVFANTLSSQYICVEAESYSEALEWLSKSEFVLVLADLIMPGLSGIELLRKIVEKYPDTAVIIVSGINQPQRALDAIRLGAFDYLIKPCDLGVLELTVERALERRNFMLSARQYKLDLEARNQELVRGKAQLQRLQAQIVQSEKMASLGQLAAGIAHELNNPVGFVYGNLDVLNQYFQDVVRLLDYYDEASLPDDMKLNIAALKSTLDYSHLRKDLASIIDDCQNGVKRICDIVQNLRIFSRLDEAEFKKTDLHEGIESTIRLLSRYFSASKIKLTRDYDKLPLIEAYSGQLNQVWMNLLANAAQAVSSSGDGSGEVRITTRVEGETVSIAVSDNGCGIDREHLDRIFDPFYTTKPVGEGTGLGLSITFGIVERHGGKIAVKTALDEGSTFTVTLPISVVHPINVVHSVSPDVDILEIL
ncbi:MAG TPA: ATP-binding protein [Pyrinomonadaceae bacterium]|jgi:signal transduction histidine kinase|nr:ATP-binding protein [Pyrinomonadaceae bacterium]